MTMGRSSTDIVRLLPVYFLCSALICPVFAQELAIEEVAAKGELNRNATISCLVAPDTAVVTWLFNDKPVKLSDRTTIQNITFGEDRKLKESLLIIKNTTRNDVGNYTCVASYGEQNRTGSKELDLSYPTAFVSENTVYTVNETFQDHGHKQVLHCIFDMYKDPEYVEWIPPTGGEPARKNATRISERLVKSSYEIDKVTYYNHNGIYTCRVRDNNNTTVSGNITLIVYGDPTVSASAIGISKSELYVNWTIDSANSEISSIILLYSKKNSTDRSPTYSNTPIKNNSTSYVIDKLEKSTTYDVQLKVKTNHSEKAFGNPARASGTTLEEDPVFVPNISINGFSATSVTIGISAPPPEIEKFVHYYLLEAVNKNGGGVRNAYHSRDSRNLPYMFDNLEPYSTYIFKVRACQDYMKDRCWNWSKPMEAATLDGVPGAPSEVTYNCTPTHMFISWQPPKKPNAEIKGYMLEFTGYAEYRNRSGYIKNETWGPLSRFKSNDTLTAWFDLQPNTNYTVRLSAMTRTRRRGDEVVKNCSTAPAPPDSPPRPRWRKILLTKEHERYAFKMHLPKVSERNGPICCYRVHMVRLRGGEALRSLPEKRGALPHLSYEEAHAARPAPGAYITDIFTSDGFPVDNEIVLGDDHTIFNSSDPVYKANGCGRCLKRPIAEAIPPPRIVTTTVTTSTTEDDGITTAPDVEPATNKEKRSLDREDYSQLPMMMDSRTPDDLVRVIDGPLDSTANYTTFVELIPVDINGTAQASMYSDYLNELMPAPSPIATVPPTTLEIALQATCGVAALILILMIAFCIMQTRRSRKMQPRPRFEMNPIPGFLGMLLGGGRDGRKALATAPAAEPPVAREDLPAAYAERHADSDYGFQKEFELLQLLSECYTDRTTHASEARENQSKNRYPDIKAYDQTRVKLSQIDGITGSDYINANYVMGYKDPLEESDQERKKFICAQGPTDTTVNDFWRMIWEHGLELIVMLTNLEEYSKVKCSKYWPDERSAPRHFGAVTVSHVKEKRFSDYIVRELKITKTPTNSEGQPIVETNGVAKRNGDIKESSETSEPTSPRAEPESRTVRQYHFLMWKDFAAPEHPQSILKFIKRVNEAWSGMVGRPAVVHCSAGVGRTGTLVALDCLLQQLEHAGHVAVFNTVAELRRQRNFLVQSQKQYVFVYRALVEYAHYGDTEIPASKLSSAVTRLRNTPEGADKCLMEHEFDKIVNGPVVEPVKSCAAAQAEELRAKNRSGDCLPYDRNRVMLTPIPARDYSTYINASFIEAYDNSEGFIITQDPLPNTIFDFWRMVSEQGVSTIVMLSELGEGKCPRYWDDGTAQYEHITVQYEDSESLPYYTRRQFRLTNTKTGYSSCVRQLQYQGWPTAPGHVPEVTRGLAELADAAAPVAAAASADHAQPPPMLVHCNLGTERSALFVALCILICQLRAERRVDVSAVARKVRQQRPNTIDTFLQYEFLYRAILNYAELHNLLEDS